MNEALSIARSRQIQTRASIDGVALPNPAMHNSMQPLSAPQAVKAAKGESINDDSMRSSHGAFNQLPSNCLNAIVECLPFSSVKTFAQVNSSIQSIIKKETIAGSRVFDCHSVLTAALTKIDAHRDIQSDLKSSFSIFRSSHSTLTKAKIDYFCVALELKAKLDSGCSVKDQLDFLSKKWERISSRYNNDDQYDRNFKYGACALSRILF